MLMRRSAPVARSRTISQKLKRAPSRFWSIQTSACPSRLSFGAQQDADHENPVALRERQQIKR